MEPGKKQRPAGLAGIESLGFMEVLNVFMVCDDSEWVVKLPPASANTFPKPA